MLTFAAPVLAFLIGIIGQTPTGTRGSPPVPPITDLTDGGTFTLQGSSFGTNVPAANQTYLCDTLEGQTNGTGLTESILGSSEWTKPGEATQLISTARTYNCGRSIRNAWTSTNYQFGIQRNYAASYLAIYTEAIYYLDVGAQEAGQVKAERFGAADAGAGEGLEDSDQPNFFYQYLPAAEGSSDQYPCNISVHNGQSQDSGNTNFNSGGGTEKLLQRSQWTRVQKFVVPGTAGTADGSAQVLSVRLDTNATICDGTRTGRIFRASGDPAFQRWTVHGYVGNGFQVSGATLDIDGALYAIVNTSSTAFPWVVWFCNKSTWAAVLADSDTVCVVQVFDSWADNEITGTFNRGQLPGLTPGTHFWGFVLSGVGTAVNSSGIVPTAALQDAANDPYGFQGLELAA